MSGKRMGKGYFRKDLICSGSIWIEGKCKTIDMGFISTIKLVLSKL